MSHSPVLKFEYRVIVSAPLSLSNFNKSKTWLRRCSRRGESCRTLHPTASPIFDSPTTAIIFWCPHGTRYVCIICSSFLLCYAINSIHWCDHDSIQSVRLYDASANVLRGEFMHAGPVLDCCFHDDSSGFSAAADNTVRRSLTLLHFLFKY